MSVGSPQRERSASPKVSADESGRVYENRSRRSDNGREVERNSDRNRYGRGSDSYKHSDRHYSRSSHGYSRHDDYIRHDKHGDVDERSHQKLSSRSCWDSSGGTHSDHGRSRDHLRNKEKFSRDKNDGSMYKSKDKDRETSFPEHNKYKDMDSSFDKAATGRRHVHPEDMERERRMMETDGSEDKKDSHRSSGDYRGDRILQHEDSKGHRSDSSSWRDDGKHHAKESYKSEVQEIGSQNLIKEGKKKYDDVETNRSKARYTREPVENSGEKYGSENQESPSKKQKISLEKDIGSRKRGTFALYVVLLCCKLFVSFGSFTLCSVSKFSSVAEPEVKESSSYQPEEGKMTTGQGQVNVPEAANDFNAAKFAAMKAAELGTSIYVSQICVLLHASLACRNLTCLMRISFQGLMV